MSRVITIMPERAPVKYIRLEEMGERKCKIFMVDELNLAACKEDKLEHNIRCLCVEIGRNRLLNAQKNACYDT